MKCPCWSQISVYILNNDTVCLQCIVFRGIIYFQLLSANNVATYGALCALASFDRQELQKNVISSRSVYIGHIIN